jgi:hypothetical protein
VIIHFSELTKELWAKYSWFKYHDYDGTWKGLISSSSDRSPKEAQSAAGGYDIIVDFYSKELSVTNT